MNAISLFSGAMGFDIGVERAGFKLRACVEKDKWACNTIRKNTNIPVLEGDINNFSADEILQIANLKLEDVDLIFGGPPCQPFSSAGKQKGLSDQRSNTIEKFISLVQDIQPRYFLLENVRGLLSAKLNDFVPRIFIDSPEACKEKGSVLFYIYSSFKDLGYTVSFSLFNAANYGVPQKRERVILFGAKGDNRIPLPNPTHYESKLLSKDIRMAGLIKPWVTLGEAFGDWIGDYYSFHDLSNFEDEFLPLRPTQGKYLKLLGQGEYWKHLPTELQKEALGKVYELSGGRTGFFRRLSFKQPSPTLVTVPTMPATMLCHPTLLRPLSIREYARIQMFPDAWEFEGDLNARYKQIGNAVPVGLGYAAAQQIIKFDQGESDLQEDPRFKHSRYNKTRDTDFIPDFVLRIQNLLNKPSEQLQLF